MDEAMIVSPLNKDTCKEFLDMLYKLRDKKTKYRYVVVSPAAQRIINETIFDNDNEYKARLEEIAGFNYSISMLWNDVDVPQAVISCLDLAKIVAVYGSYEDEQMTINDLLNSDYIEWQKPEKQKEENSA